MDTVQMLLHKDIAQDQTSAPASINLETEKQDIVGQLKKIYEWW